MQLMLKKKALISVREGLAEESNKKEYIDILISQIKILIIF